MHVRAGGYVIGAGVHIYIWLWTKKYLNCTLVIDSPFQTFARTSRRIYRLALPLHAPEMLS